MNTSNFKTLLGVCFVSAACALAHGEPPAKTQPAVPAASQPAGDAATLLNLRKGIMIPGQFNGVATILFATSDVRIHSDDTDILAARVQNYFPLTYKATIREVLDSIAVQTDSSWKWDGGRFVFAKPAPPRAYTVNLPTGWKPEEHSEYVAYGPENAPPIVSIYQLGSYSADKPSEAFFNSIRDDQAAAFARSLRKNAKPSEMKKMQVAGVEALYWETEPPNPNATWRQWVFVKNGQAFAFVSGILKESEKTMLPKIQLMIDSFKLANEKPAK